jgi:SAM-dependent methyltransferase
MRGLLARAVRRSGQLTFASASDVAPGPPPERFRQALSLVGPLTGRSVIDVGCWTGGLLSLCASAGAAHLVGIDLEGPWLEVATRAVPTAQFKAVKHLGELDRAGVAPADVVFFLETLEHLPRGSEPEALRALHGLVGHGGRLILSTPVAGLAALLDPAWSLVGHRHYRPHTVEGLLLCSGFRPVARWYSGDTREVLDVALFYATKHLLRRPYQTPSFLRRPQRAPTARRRPDATTVWVEAVRDRDPPPKVELRLTRAWPTEIAVHPLGPPPSSSTSADHDDRLPLRSISRTPPAVVVPTRNSARTLEACLRSLRAQTMPCAIVVVDNGSTDATLEIARRLADRVHAAGPERSAQRNIGASLVLSEVVGFVDSDMLVGPDVVARATRALEEGAGAVIVPERSFGVGFWAEVRAFERSFYVGSDSVEAARFFRRDVFEALGGFDETLPPGPEDWDLTRRTRASWPVARIDGWIDHDEGHPTLPGLLRKKAYYAPGLKAYARKHGAAAATSLDRPYLRRPWLIATKGPRIGAGLIVLKSGEAVAVLSRLRPPGRGGTGGSP